MSTEANDITEKLLKDVGAAAMKDFEAIKNALETHGISIGDLSFSLMKNMIRNVQEKKCTRCGFVGEDLQHLKKHLKSEGHFYGQGNLAVDKKKLIQRIKNRRNDNSLPEVSFPISSDETQRLTAEEAAAFNSFAKDANLTVAEEFTFGNLLYTSLNCIIMRSSVDAPSSAIHNAAAKGLTRALANSSAVAAALNAEAGGLTNAFEELAV